MPAHACKTTAAGRRKPRNARAAAMGS
ncbi:MAG: hypothetical protein K0Q71_6075, partial [Thermomicrobiales bacterium]|nr:hypothetical protein [Thermomicrobiales bacterium]